MTKFLVHTTSRLRADSLTLAIVSDGEVPGRETFGSTWGYLDITRGESTLQLGTGLLEG